MEATDDFAGRAREAVRSIPAGRVASYGAVAAAAGHPGAARAVGRVLRGVGAETDIPWWRVLNGRGVLTIPRSGLARPLQRALLQDEGIEFDDAGRIDMARFGWDFGLDDDE